MAVELKWKVYPVAGMPGNITGNFGDDYGNRLHRGTDVGVLVGTPIVAPADGRLVQFTNNGDFGKAVCLEHPGTGWFSLYAHMDRVDRSLWSYVKAGDRLGLSGNTGMSTGPHLHWQVCRNTQFPIDINLSRDAMKVPFEEEEVAGMTPEQEKLLLLVASVVGGWSTGQQFTSVEEANGNMQIHEDADQRVLIGMGLMQRDIERLKAAVGMEDE